MPFLFFSIARDNVLHRAHRLSAFASIFPFATMVYCTKQQEIYQESQRNDVATGNAGWPSQTQTQTQRCGALRVLPIKWPFWDISIDFGGDFSGESQMEQNGQLQVKGTFESLSPTFQSATSEDFELAGPHFL